MWITYLVRFEGCPVLVDTLWNEGMSAWAEIQYIYQVGEVDFAKRLEDFDDILIDLDCLKRNGLSVYKKQYPFVKERGRLEKTPFMSKFPLQIM